MSLLDFLIDTFTTNGYTTMFVVLLLCGFGIPIPEDLSLIAGGVIAGLGYANVHGMYAIGVLGVLSGDSVMFLIGRYLGPRALRQRWVARLLTPRRYAQVQRRFTRYGTRLMFVARFLPGLRAPIYLTAGMTRRVRFHHFLLLDGVAALISVPIWVYLGYYGALNHEWLLVWIKRSKIAVGVGLVVLAIVAGVYFWYRSRRLRLRLQELRARRRAAAEARQRRRHSPNSHS